jgi:hypothetical protein
MKRLVTFFTGLLFSFTGFSQPCLPEGIRFEKQSQIDSFQINYPYCTIIEGDVQIGDYFSSDVSNLSGLSVLTSIGGDLSIGNEYQGNPYLSSLTGLDNLISIGGVLSIQNNAITNLMGLNNLVYADSISIQMNSSLINLTGLDALNSILGGLYIGQNYALVSLTGLENLTYIGGNLAVYHNYDLISLIGLEGLNSIGGKLEIIGNQTLISLSGLDNITAGSITDLNIYYNDALSICAIQSICDYLSNPNGIVNIYSNANGCDNPPEIADDCGFTISCLPFGNYYFLSQDDIDDFQIDYPVCNQIEGNITVDGNSINNLAGLNSITTISGDLIFHHSGYLHDMLGFEQLSNVGGNLTIFYNDSLKNMIGLENLTNIGGHLSIQENHTLVNLTGFNSLNSIGGYFDVRGNDSLQDILALGSLSNIGDYLNISTYKLKRLDGLNALTSVGGYLSIYGNYSLNNLISLSNLSSIGEFLLISRNYVLNDLNGLDNIDANSISYLEITNNPALSDCDVQSICNYLISPNGDILIEDNTSGCNSREEVEAACGVGVEEEGISHTLLNIYPNPSSTQITIEANMPLNHGLLKIFSLNGHELNHYQITKPKMNIDISYFPAGVYFVRFSSENEVRMFKLVKY